MDKRVGHKRRVDRLRSGVQVPDRYARGQGTDCRAFLLRSREVDRFRISALLASLCVLVVNTDDHGEVYLGRVVESHWCVLGPGERPRDPGLYRVRVLQAPGDFDWMSVPPRGSLRSRDLGAFQTGDDLIEE